MQRPVDKQGGVPGGLDLPFLKEISKGLGDGKSRIFSATFNVEQKSH